MIQGMVNDPTVLLQKSMKVASHTSVLVHMSYLSSDRVSKGKKIEGFLRRNNVVTEKEKKTMKPDTCKVDYEPVKIFHEPEHIQEHCDAFQNEAYRMFRPCNPSS